MQEFIYKPTDDSTYCVTGYTGDEAEVVIPDSYGSGVITVIGDGLFSGHSEITRVHIPDTVTNMGEFIFDGCEIFVGSSCPLRSNAFGATLSCAAGSKRSPCPTSL